jgi:hypothetical protein
MEKRIPSFQTVVRSVPANAQKSLPPDPPLRDSTLLKRSSSIYTRATGIWDDEFIISNTTRADRQDLSSNNPEFSVPSDSPTTPWDSVCINPTSPILEPRPYDPVLPSPSPSLAPQSRNNSYFQPFQTHSSFDGSEQGEKLWTKLVPWPSFSPVQMERKSSQPLLELPSRKIASTGARARSESPLASRLSHHFSPVVTHKREGSINTALASLGITAEPVVPSRGRQRSRIIPPKALEHKSMYKLALLTMNQVTNLIHRRYDRDKAFHEE